MQSAEKKSELSTKLREICAEIESKDGRKIELIKRVIISGFKKGMDVFIASVHVVIPKRWTSESQGSRYMYLFLVCSVITCTKGSLCDDYQYHRQAPTLG